MRAIKCSMSQFFLDVAQHVTVFLGCRAKILACRSDMLKPLVDQPAITMALKTKCQFIPYCSVQSGILVQLSAS